MIMVIKFHAVRSRDGLTEVLMTYTNFQVGEKFPLPIQATGDGGLFQIDANGAMFILKLSRTDLIATEAFRTGKMELALFEEDGIAFFLYQIDGIFKEGWGDCPFSIHQLPSDLIPNKVSTDQVLHLYLVDSRLDILLAMRRIELSDAFQNTLEQIIKRQKAQPLTWAAYQAQVQQLWSKYPSARMRELATAVEPIALAIPDKPINH